MRGLAERPALALFVWGLLRRRRRPQHGSQIGEGFHFLVLQLGICGQFFFDPAIKGFLIGPIGFQLFTLVPELFQNHAQGIIHLCGVVIPMEKKVYVDLPPFTGRNVPITEIAAAMHKDAQYVRIGLQQGILKFRLCNQAGELQ